MPITEYLTIGNVVKITSLLISLSKDSPLKKMALGEYEMAIYVLNNMQDEHNLREHLNRALTHLESAYVHYLPCITTWDIWDQYSALHGKRTFANTMCIYIAIIHFILGNNRASKQWLLKNLDTDGGIYFPEEILPYLSMPDEDSFYRIVCGEDFYKVEQLKSDSVCKYRADQEHKDSWGDYGFDSGGIYSG